MFEIQALPDSPQFDVEVTLDLFESNLFSCVAERKVDLSETADADSTFDRVTFKRF